MKITLIESYQENIDYKIKVLPPKGQGRPSEEIMLTPSCFKRLSMMSRTPKAEQVRDYFLKIEAHLDKYKNYIFESLCKKIDKKYKYINSKYYFYLFNLFNLFFKIII